MQCALDQWSETSVARKAPDKSFTDGLHTQAKIKRDSAYLDSRIDRWCHHTGGDPELHRLALASGYTVRFTIMRRGRSILLHVVRPSEVE